MSKKAISSPQGRGRPSSIDLLPEDLRIELNAALRERRLTQKEIVAHINSLLSDRGLKPISYSATNRYAMHIEADCAQLREAREAANAIVGGLNEQQQGGDLGRAIAEIVKGLTYEAVSARRRKAQDAGEPVDLEFLGDLSLTLQRLERAAKTGIDRELKIKETYAEECSRKLDAAVDRGDITRTAAQQAREEMGWT